MNKTLIRSLGAAALVAALAAPFSANAESSFATGTGGLSTSARIDFQITIPKFVALRVGTAGVNNVDLISFTVPALNVGDSTPVVGTGGDLTNGVVTASVLGNGGTVTLGASTVGALTNGGAGSINWSQITTVSSAPGVLPAPVLANGPSATVPVAATAGIVNASATWTYGYSNANVLESGTYGGVNANNGRVTYTASVL
jgi:hypothetical protein